MSRQSALWVRWIGTGAAGMAPSGGFEVNGCSKERDAASRLAGQSLSWKKRSICLWLLPPALTRRWLLVGAAWAQPGHVSALLPLLHLCPTPLYRQPPQQLLSSRSVCIYCWLIPSGSSCFFLHCYKGHFCVPLFISPHRNVKLFWCVFFTLPGLPLTNFKKVYFF